MCYIMISLCMTASMLYVLNTDIIVYFCQYVICVKYWYHWTSCENSRIHDLSVCEMLCLYDIVTNAMLLIYVMILLFMSVSVLHFCFLISSWCFHVIYFIYWYYCLCLSVYFTSVFWYHHGVFMLYVLNTDIIVYVCQHVICAIDRYIYR